MKDFIISVTSITYAIKAQNALRAVGIRANVARDERYLQGTGCGYSVVVPGNVDRVRVMDILQQQHIKLANVMGGERRP